MYEYRYLTNSYSPAYQQVNWDASSPAPYYIVPTAYQRWSETCQDEIGVDGTFRDCLHTSETNEFQSPDFWYCCASACRGNSTIAHITAARINALRSAAQPPAYNMDQLAIDAIDRMLPRVNEGTSLVNFLLELKDFKKMKDHGHALSGALSRIRGMTPKKRRWGTRHFGRYDPDLSKVSYADASYRLKGGRKAVVKDILKRLSGAHLETAFGTVPFARDVAQIFGTLASLEYRVAQLKRFAGTIQQRHFRRFLPIGGSQPEDRNWKQLSSTTSGWGGSILPGDVNYQFDAIGGTQPSVRSAVRLNTRMRWIARPVYHATMRYTYVLPELDTMLDRLWLFMDALGVRWDPNILWNAIPYSFVVDWVVDVQSFLADYRRDNWPIQTQIHDFCHSVKYHGEYAIDISWPCGSGVYYVGSPGEPFQRWWQKSLPDLEPSVSYKRTAGISNYQEGCYQGSTAYYKRTRHFGGTRSLVTRYPNVKQASLAVSLITNRVVGGKTRVRGD
jgi:hypothetical protein